MKRAFWAFGSAIVVLLAVSRCSTTKVTVARLATATPTSPPARSDAAPPPTRTPMPVVTTPRSRYDQTPGVIYEQRVPTPAATARPPAPAPPPATGAVPLTPTPTPAAPAMPPTTARPTAAAPRSVATAPRSTATATRVPSTALPPTATRVPATAVPPTATLTRVSPTETAVPPTVTAPARREGAAKPTPTRKPGAYYEEENVPFRLAVTWTSTPTPPGKRR